MRPDPNMASKRMVLASFHDMQGVLTKFFKALFFSSWVFMTAKVP
jgi:hypothetical protein